MDAMALDVLALLFLAGLAGGFVDAIAGGGGLISVPALLATGMGPVAALATNKAQAMFGSFTATRAYAKRGHVDLRAMKAAVAWTFTGSVVGAVAVQSLSSDIMMQLIPFLLIAAALYFAFGPNIGHVDRHHLMNTGPFYMLFGLGIGFYDGFFGPGTGRCWALACVSILGFNMLKATAHTKVVNFTSNFAAFLVFAVGGHVLWLPALVMAAGQLVGARLGANTAMKHGAGVIRPMLVVMSLAITAKLIYDDPDNILHIWIRTWIA
ncbi:MAG: TSUP family transporter [Alphaproteobacteria bacterium]|nr:TSUP family transporter [Alphaproteobacteria bacterium]